MGILRFLFLLFLFTFPTGVIARIQFQSGAAVSLNDIILLILVIYWIALKFFNSQKTSKYYLKNPIILFLSIGLISLILNLQVLGVEKFFVAFFYLARFTGYIFLYFIVKEFSKEFKSRIYNYMFFSGFIVLILGYVQYFFYPSLRNLFYLGWDEHLYRMFSVFLDPNFAGAFFSLYFIFTINYAKERFRKISNLKFYFLCLVSLASLFSVYLTYSRSALIMLFVSFLIYLIIIKKNKLIFFFAFILVGLIFISPKAFQTEGTNLLRIASSTERIKSFQIATEIIAENPIFGVGFNAYRYAQNRRGLDNAAWLTTHSGAGTDSSFLFVFATTGIIGFFAYIHLIYKTLLLGKKNFHKNNYGVLLFSVLIGLIINSFFINSLFYVFLIEWIWILAGLTESN